MSNPKDPNKVYGQTINFRYYVEKKVKPKSYIWQGKLVEGYPLYLQVTVKRQTSLRKSVLGHYIAPEALADFLQKNSQAIADETNALREQILKFKPFENANFSLKYALNNYTVLQEDICSIIGELLQPDYEKALISDTAKRFNMISDLRSKLKVDKSKQDHPFNTHSRLSSMHKVHIREYNLKKAKLIVLARNGFNPKDTKDVFGNVFSDAVESNKRVKKLYDLYGHEFWNLVNYCQKIRKDCNITVITVFFFLSGDFKSAFVNRFSEGEYNALYQGFNRLRKIKPKFDKMIKSYYS